MNTEKTLFGEPLEKLVKKGIRLGDLEDDPRKDKHLVKKDKFIKQLDPKDAYNLLRFTETLKQHAEKHKSSFDRTVLLAVGAPLNDKSYAEMQLLLVGMQSFENVGEELIHTLSREANAALTQSHDLDNILVMQFTMPKTKKESSTIRFLVGTDCLTYPEWKYEAKKAETPYCPIHKCIFENA